MTRNDTTVTLSYGIRPPEPMCADVDREYTFRFSTGRFTWRVCWNGTGIPDSGTYRIYVGQRVLKPAESAKLRSALDNLRLRPPTIACGSPWQKPEAQLRVEPVDDHTPATYWDAYFGCGDKIKQRLHLEDVYAAAHALQRTPDGSLLVAERFPFIECD